MDKINDNSTESNQIYGLSEALAMVGDQNRYQYRIFFILVIVVMCNCFSLIAPTYLFLQPPLLCDGEPCEQNANNCQAYDDIIPDPDFKFYNLVCEFNLFCDRKIYISVYQSITFAGSVIGGVYFSYLGDQHGRKVAWIVSWLVTTSGTIGLVTSYNLIQLIVSNFVIGLGLIPCYVTGFVIINESSGEQFRQKGSVFLLVALALAEILLALIYYISTNWRLTFLVTVTIPSILVLLLSFFVYETPKYYISKKQKDKAFEVLDKIAIVNAKPKFTEFALNNPNLLNDQLSGNYQSYAENVPKKNYQILDLFRYKSLRSATFGFMCISFAMHLIFYGSQYGIDEIADGNLIYVMGAIVGTAELIGFYSINFFVAKIKRRVTNMIGFSVSILACFGFLFYGVTAASAQTHCNFCPKQIVIISLACIIRVFNSYGFALLAIYPNEFYPTCIRSIGSGFVFTVGILGSFSSPYVISIANQINVNPYLCIGLISLIGPLGGILIKETLGKPLQDEIDENRLNEEILFKEEQE